MKWFHKIWTSFSSLFSRDTKNPSSDKEIASKLRSDNLPSDQSAPLPIKESTEELEDDLWYPNRVRDPRTEHLRMKTRGYYLNHFPQGAVVHTTGGRSRSQNLGGHRNAVNNYEQGIREVINGVNSEFCYFLIDRDGNVHQHFPLNRWGYHAGESSYPGFVGSLSSKLVGIEVACAGKLETVNEQAQIYRAYFTNEKKGDFFFYRHEVEKWEETENIEAGVFHKMTDEQKASLADLILWMDSKRKGFLLDYAIGHDEASPGRKSDPGGSLGMTMSDFREMLRDIKQHEKKDVD